ncbi:uncharacterized protein [Euphorbia lathyris]|uniref:uncharacterized protein isoform X2 n=1 Tax=Euphorbia lathyris TaxID=212925 RepID=UPI0033136E9C
MERSLTDEEINKLQATEGKTWLADEKVLTQLEMLKLETDGKIKSDVVDYCLLSSASFVNAGAWQEGLLLGVDITCASCKSITGRGFGKKLLQRKKKKLKMMMIWMGSRLIMKMIQGV